MTVFNQFVNVAFFGAVNKGKKKKKQKKILQTIIFIIF